MTTEVSSNGVSASGDTKYKENSIVGWTEDEVIIPGTLPVEADRKLLQALCFRALDTQSSLLKLQLQGNSPADSIAQTTFNGCDPTHLAFIVLASAMHAPPAPGGEEDLFSFGKLPAISTIIDGIKGALPIAQIKALVKQGLTEQNLMIILELIRPEVKKFLTPVLPGFLLGILMDTALPLIVKALIAVI